jgi:Flp pilus assembly protein TadG
MIAALKTITQFRANLRAAAAVEFAFVAPLLLIMIFGIVVWGSYLAVVHGVQQLAAEAARSSIAGLSDSERTALAQSYVSANVGAYPLITPQRITVNAAASGTSANVFVVTVSYDASNMSIFMLPTFVPAPPQTIVRSAVIPYGGF